MLTISAVSFFLVGPIGDHQKIASQGIASLLVLGNVGAYKYSGDYFSPNPNPLVHTWSLSVEEQIYIFLPLILLLILKNRKNLKKSMAFFLGVVSVFSFVSFLFPRILEPLYFRVGIESSSQFSFYSPTDRIWQFMIGGIVYFLLDRNRIRLAKIPKSIHLLMIIMPLVVLFSPIDLNLKVGSIFASFFGVILILFKSLDELPNFLIQKLVWVGDRSYSIYLVHLPLLYLTEYSPVTQIGGGESHITQSVVAVVASILLGALSYSKIENRFRSAERSNASGFKTFSVAIVLTLALPTSLFAVMDRGVKHQYWGLDKDIQQPAYAGALDPNCARDSENGPPCEYRNMEASKTVLLIGDSHAGHISQALIDAGQSTNWNTVVWTHSGCPVQFQRSIPKQVSDNCLDVNNLMKKWVVQNKPDAIILSQFVKSDSSQSDLRDALSTLQLMVPRLLLIENNPIFPDARDFMIKRAIVMPRYKPPKSFQQSEMQRVDMNASDLLANWARRNSISTMSFESLFCKKGVCSRHSDKGWLYRDYDHLSVAGAELTIPQLSAFLRRS